MAAGNLLTDTVRLKRSFMWVHKGCISITAPYPRMQSPIINAAPHSSLSRELGFELVFILNFPDLKNRYNRRLFKFIIYRGANRREYPR